MSASDQMVPELGRRRGGCLSGGLGAGLLIALAPFAAAVRAWKTWRRGADARLSRTCQAVAAVAGDALCMFVVDIDVPAREEPAWRRRLTETLVRIAETLREPDDVYHLLQRAAAGAATDLLAVGPLVQELGDRVDLCLGHPPLECLTAVWLTLPRDRSPLEVVDPEIYDPEVRGEPDALMRGAGARWSAASVYQRRGPAVVYRIAVCVPDAARARVEAILAALERAPGGR